MCTYFAPAYHGLQECLLDVLSTRHAPELRGHELPYLQTLPRLLGVPQIVLHLQTEPAIRCLVERNRQTDRHFGANARASIQNGGQGVTADTQ